VLAGPGCMSDQRHASRRSGTQGATRRHQHQPWQDPPLHETGIRKFILTGTQRARRPACTRTPASVSEGRLRGRATRERLRVEADTVFQFLQAVPGPVVPHVHPELIPQGKELGS
jgi:hypothetical protein